MKLSAVLIAKNEEKNIAACLESVAFCDERIVVDSESTDRTRLIAESAKAKVFTRAFSDFASQKNFAMEQASGEWIFLIDADERVSPELKKQILDVARSDTPFDGFWVLRRNHIFGRCMRYGANRQDLQLRLLRRGCGLFEGLVHERVRCDGSVGRIKGSLEHFSTPTIAAYLQKFNPYTSLEARILRMSQSDHESAMMKKPLLIFLRDFFWRGGLLDGIEGFIFAFLSAYYDFVKRAKAWEIGPGRDKITASNNK